MSYENIGMNIYRSRVGGGDFKLQETLLLQGAYARLTSATVQG